MRNNKILYCVSLIIIFVLLVLTFSYRWEQINYGNISIEEIIYTLNMPLKGTSDSLLGNYFYNAFLPVICIFVMYTVISWPYKNKISILVYPKIHKNVYYRFHLLPIKRNWRRWNCLMACWFLVLLFTANNSLGIFEFFKNQFVQSQLIKEEYVDPNDVLLVFPEQKRNLICIFVESAETSNQDISNGGLFDENYIPEMTELAKLSNLAHSEPPVRAK